MKTIFGITLALAALPLRAQSPNVLVDQLLDRIVARERAFLESVQKRTPLIETYIQETPDALQAGEHPTRDHYFLGRFRLGAAVSYQPLIEHTDVQPPKSAPRLSFRALSVKSRPLEFLPRGFAQMAVIDLEDFNRRTYRFEYVHREFLGEIRCLVFDVGPVNRQQPGKFLGRIWVEDRDNSIVRFNGTYMELPTPKGTLPALYFHFDSWRVNTGGADWVPAEIYVEEEGAPDKNAAGAAPRFKAQTRIWDYTASSANKTDELTSILIESESAPRDEATSKDVSPLESQRSWERQAEENVLTRLEKGGFLAPPGAVDNVLNTVVNNLIVSANLNVDAHCRVLLTTPIETFSV